MASKVSIQDFSLIHANVKRIQLEHEFNDHSTAFTFFALSMILGLQDDEVLDSVTDTHFLKVTKKPSGHDRGIDSVYIDETVTPVTVHLFNFKYSDDFEKIKTNNFPSSEIDKILSFLNSLMQKEKSLKDEVNLLLYSKAEEIWAIFETQNPRFVIHICANYYNGFEKKEKERFERGIHIHSNFEIEYHFLPNLVNMVTRKDKKLVNGKIKAIDKNFFEKSDGDIRALIVDLDARDLVRIVLDDEHIRNKTDISNYAELKEYEICEDAFEDNVRIYLKQRSKINRNIKRTVLSNDNHRFFYYNNGITLTCDRFSYSKTVRSPIIEMENIQVVNGSQTIHALYDAFLENSIKLDDVDILCRIYETKNAVLSTNIAEYTNSQNPVKSRDIRSIDYVQQKLEQELLLHEYYYERKKGQYANRPKKYRLDAEKVGQVLMSFYNEMPSEAKNKKGLMFAEKYEEVFGDNLTAEKVLIAYSLYERIENAKNQARDKIIESPRSFEKESYLLYASYYFLYILSQLSKMRSIEFSLDKVEEMWSLYPAAVKVLEKIIEKERESFKNYQEKYSLPIFLKTNKPKKRFEDLVETNELDQVIS